MEIYYDMPLDDIVVHQLMKTRLCCVMWRQCIAVNLCMCVHAALAKKYYQVLQRYYVQYMSGYDADVLNQLIQVSLPT